MRILIAHPGVDFSVHDVFVGWSEALRDLGQQVSRFNFHDRICFYDKALIELEGRGPAGELLARKALSQDEALTQAVEGLYAILYRQQPDVLIVVSGFFIPPELMDLARSKGTRVVVLHTESPYEDSRQIRRAEHADLNLVNDPTNLVAFRTVSPTHYFPHAYRPSVHHPGEALPELACDFGFVGTAFPSRIAFFERMTLPERSVLAGNWRGLDEDSPVRRFVRGDVEECLDNDQTADLYRSAKASINVYRREAPNETTVYVGWAMGPREVELAATGCFFLRDPRPEGDELLHMLPTFSSPEEASEQLRWWLEHDAEREKAALAAREAVADRTFIAQAKKLLVLLDT